MKFSKLLMVLFVAVLTGIASPSRADGPSFNPAVSLDIGYGATLRPTARSDSGSGLAAGLAFSALGNKVRGVGLGAGVVIGDETPQGGIAFVLYSPIHLIAFGGEDCSWGDDCRSGGFAVYAAPFWAPSKRTWGITFGLSLIGGKGR